MVAQSGFKGYKPYGNSKHKKQDVDLLYESARRILAHALVESKKIRSMFKNTQLDGTWHLYGDYHIGFTIPAQMTDYVCPICISLGIEIH